MIDSLLKLHEFLNFGEIKFGKNGIKEIVQNYSYFFIIGNSTLDEDGKEQILQNFQKSRLIIIDQIQKQNEGEKEKFFVIGFENTLIILESSNFQSFLSDLFSNSSSVLLCILPNAKSYVGSKFSFQNREIEIDSNFTEEIANLSKSFAFIASMKLMNQIWLCIVPCISGYLIKKSYLQRNKYRINQFIVDIEEKTRLKLLVKMIMLNYEMLDSEVNLNVH